MTERPARKRDRNYGEAEKANEAEGAGRGEEEREGAETEGKREDRERRKNRIKEGGGHLPRLRPSELVSG